MHQLTNFYLKKQTIGNTERESEQKQTLLVSTQKKVLVPSLTFATNIWSELQCFTNNLKTVLLFWCDDDDEYGILQSRQIANWPPTSPLMSRFDLWEEANAHTAHKHKRTHKLTLKKFFILEREN